MVDELKFEDNSSPWEHHTRDPQGYMAWAEEKKGQERVVYPFVTGTGMDVVQGEVIPAGKKLSAKRATRGKSKRGQA